MTSLKEVATVTDSVTITLNESDLTEKKLKEFSETKKRNVPCSDGLQWWFRWYPAGDRLASAGHLSVFLWVNKPVYAKYMFAVENSDISWSCAGTISDDCQGWGRMKFASHEQLRPLFRDGILKVTCNVSFDIEVPYTSSVPSVFQLFDHAPTDVELIVGSERIPVHKYFLLLISPVFQAMFSHNTAESKSGKVKITDFDYDTVKAAIDMCYGRYLKHLSIKLVVSILRFADKYFITALTNQFEKIPFVNLSVETFCTILRYAYDFNKDLLLTTCYTFFKDNQAEIKATKQFADLPPVLVVIVLKTAFNLKTNFDVLRYAHKNGIDFVVEHLEQPLLTHITLQNFCIIVDYAWECSRDGLKKVCAEFFNDNTLDVMNLKDFPELPAEKMQKLVRAGYAIKHGAQ